MFHPPELWDFVLTRSRVEGGVRLWLRWVFKERSSGNPGIPRVGSVTPALFVIGQNKPLLRVLHRKLSHCCCLTSDLLNICCVGCLEVIIVLGKKTQTTKGSRANSKEIQMKKTDNFSSPLQRQILFIDLTDRAVCVHVQTLIDYLRINTWSRQDMRILPYVFFFVAFVKLWCSSGLPGGFIAE